MPEATKRRFPSILLILVAIFLATPACDEEPLVPEQELDNLTGVWDLSETITANACDGGVGTLKRERVILVQCNTTVSVIMEDGLVGQGAVVEDNLNFMCTEEHVDNVGCCSSHYLVGHMVGSSSRLEGSISTSVAPDEATCGQSNLCKVETRAALELVEPYEDTCMSGITFGSPLDSEYELPWRSGRSYELYAGYCVPTGEHRNQRAYDFLIPVGEEVLAARAGVVRAVNAEQRNDGNRFDPVHVIVEHEDGTAAFYAHLKRNSIVVEPGEQVETGHVLGLAGYSPTTPPSGLHFAVFSGYPPIEGQDLAVNFSNADGPLDCKGGLVQGAFYTNK